MNDKPAIASSLPQERIASIDLLRGFAVLGILIMNIQSFSMIGAAYMNPSAYGDFTGINKWIWIISHVFASEKFMSVFSMLFGAGVILFTERALEKGRRAGPLHYRRNFWLLVFGLVHGYLIWYGDILVNYSVCAFFVFLFRKMKPKKLVIYSAIFFIVPLILYSLTAWSMPFWPEAQYNESIKSWLPTAELIAKEIDHMQGTWGEQMEHRAPMVFFMQTFLFLYMTFWRVTAMMLLGMALYKLGVLSAQKSKAFYIRLTVIGLVVGYSISSFGVFKNIEANWSYDFSMFIGSQFNYVGSVASALGYIGLLMLISKSVNFNKLKTALSSVGKMAFTNYILMSLICTFVFYGHGLGYFGQVDRVGQVLIVLVTWAFLLIISPLWLKSFYYGPLEWLWRMMTYWKYHPMKKE